MSNLLFHGQRCLTLSIVTLDAPAPSARKLTAKSNVTVLLVWTVHIRFSSERFFAFMSFDLSSVKNDGILSHRVPVVQRKIIIKYFMFDCKILK